MVNKSRYYIKYLLLILFYLLFIGCSAKISLRDYNAPFVDSKETVGIDFGMTKNEILELMGTPLYVESGIIDNKTIIWVYEVRTYSVLSLKNVRGKSLPQKNNTPIKHDDPIHKLKIEFNNGIVTKWGYIDTVIQEEPIVEEEVVQPSPMEHDTMVVIMYEEKRKKVKKARKKIKLPKLAFPKIKMPDLFYELNISIGMYAYDFEETVVDSGVIAVQNTTESELKINPSLFIGKRYSFGDLGFEIGLSFMPVLKFETQVSGYLFNTKLGPVTYKLSTSSKEYKDDEMTVESHELDQEDLIIGMGVGKHMNVAGYWITPRFNMDILPGLGSINYYLSCSYRFN